MTDPETYQPNEHKALTTKIAQFEAVFAKELTPELARQYVASLVKKLGGENQGFDQFVDQGKRLHYRIGKDIYGPLLVGYTQWLTDRCAQFGHEGSVFFALRDAAPLLVAAEVLWDETPLTPIGVYANRPLLGIEDEIAPERSIQNGEVSAYLNKKGIGVNQRVIWADTGAWGTVVKALKSSILSDSEMYPLFWYSHNPYIPGYLNELLAHAHMDPSFCEVVNDSLECMFPQQHLRPLAVTPDASGVILIPSNHLSVTWGREALRGVCDAALAWKTGISLDEQIAQVKQLKSLHDQARSTGEWTGVLPTNTPTWSQGDAFLNAWSSNLLP